MEKKKIIIDSVSTMIETVKKLRNKIMEDGDSFDLYFRGQEVEEWDIEPSIFRNDMVSVEHQLMQIPLQIIPMEFKEFNSKFDVMTKYQHYGMCTRLLDLTTNPLVALYFASQPRKKVEIGLNEEPNGVIYFTKKYSPIQSSNEEVQVISALATYDLTRDNSMSKILDKLVDDHVLEKEKIIEWKTNKDYIRRFIDIVQNNYIVVPVYTNERLSRQSGVFLLASNFIVEKKQDPENIEEYVISKSKKVLNDEFEDTVLIVNGDDKERILKELDLLNINEATLFPELEHQLNYIKSVNGEKVQPVSEFVKYEKNHQKDFDVLDEKSYKNLNKEIISIIHAQLQKLVSAEEAKNIIEEIQMEFVIDWYKKDSAKSKVKMNLIRNLQKSCTFKGSARDIADQIMKKVNFVIEEYGDYVKETG